MSILPIGNTLEGLLPNLSSDQLWQTPSVTNFGSQVGGIGGLGSNGFGLNLDTAKLALSGLGTIGNLWAAFSAQDLAKQQFSFTKAITEKNLANQIKSYNTGLSDRARSRAVTEGQSDQERDAYIAANSLGG